MYVVLRNSFCFVFFHSFFQKSSRDGDYLYLFYAVCACFYNLYLLSKTQLNKSKKVIGRLLFSLLLPPLN